MPVGHDKAGQGASVFRAFLRALPDDIAVAREDGMPIVLERDTPLPAHAQRLMDSLGVEVRLVTQPVVAARGMGHYLLDGERESFVENVIDFRHSVVQANKRADAGDETLEICPHCMCEVDITPAPHRPGCPGIGAARTTNGPVLPTLEAPRAAATQVRPADPPRASTTSQGPVRVDDVTDEIDASSSDLQAHPEPEAAAESSASGGAKKLRESKWTRELVFDRLHTAVEKLGRLPLSREYGDHGLPGPGPVTKIFGNWGNLCEEAGYPRPSRGAPHAAMASQRPKETPGGGAAADEAVEFEPAPEERETERLGPDAPAPQTLDATKEPEPRPAPDAAPREAPPEAGDHLEQIRVAALALTKATFALLDLVEAALPQEEPHE